MELKTQLRARLLDRRRALDPETVRRASALACTRLAALPEWAAAGTVALYVGWRGEADPLPLLDAAGGRRVALPVIAPGEELLRFYAVDGAADLAPGAFGIPAPVPEAARAVAAADLDLVVVPGVAFDAEGRRLGLGRGYYDRLLAAAPRALRVGFAFEWQLVASVPVEAHDLSMDLVVTEGSVLRPSRASDRTGAWRT